MTISVFDLFKIGLGPSSSHTVGPMLAALQFSSSVPESGVISIRATLYGSLSLTGAGHATDKAVTLGLAGCHPETTQPDQANMLWHTVCQLKELSLPRGCRVGFDPHRDIVFDDHPLPEHPNGMLFEAMAADGQVIASQVYFSVGGGFIVSAEEWDETAAPQEQCATSYPFSSGEQLQQLCEQNSLSIAELVMANECTEGNDKSAVNKRLDAIWLAMESCMQRGYSTSGVLPGGLGVERRAPELYLRWQKENAGKDPLQVMDWVNVCALAVNEENAAGGRVVTSPTNGAAGVIPAVIAFHKQYDRESNSETIRQFLLTAAAIGMLYKKNASISAAEVGCQGEIGVASSMAAAGLAAVWGGSIAQVENAAEIAMEHHLGMTCDPVAGLVQVPCIERNSMGAVKAINAARLAVSGDGRHRVSLDQVIATMYQTGKDMQDRYKETSLGGLAVNVVYC
ncbi:L-serine ammonia-lyase [Parendozoicomonas sp. Alg238-R29]|uniref:L-serine ammonia-lyase n=1 Tax=Parendozoicomonas sp. Alg238-R29 TaxID=2993446 RepID=UPI00248DB9AC|nr:L-serine ammonia-lyase [Parendozoicomonas sp. Alg238-R29]